MLNPIRFNEFPWGGVEETVSTHRSGGYLKCGICAKAKTLGCLTWSKSNTTKQDMWIDGTNDWINYGGSRKWVLHAIYVPRKQSVDFLMNRFRMILICKLKVSYLILRHATVIPWQKES